MEQDSTLSHDWQHRSDEERPYDNWQPFPEQAIVQVKYTDGGSDIVQSGQISWEYREKDGEPASSVVASARRLDKPLVVES